MSSDNIDSWPTAEKALVVDHPGPKRSIFTFNSGFRYGEKLPKKSATPARSI